MTKAQALAILSDVVDFYVEGADHENASQATEALATLAKDWHPEDCVYVSEDSNVCITHNKNH